MAENTEALGRVRCIESMRVALALKEKSLKKDTPIPKPKKGYIGLPKDWRGRILGSK